MTNFAEGVADLEDADSSEVLLSGLSTGASARSRRSESAAVGTVDDAGRSITLADNLERLHTQTKVLEKAQASMSWAQRAAKALALGLKFLPLLISGAILRPSRSSVSAVGAMRRGYSSAMRQARLPWIREAHTGLIQLRRNDALCQRGFGGLHQHRL